MPNRIEDKAVELVMKYERRQGRQPRRLKDGGCYDIKSSQRCIEVKGSSDKKCPSNILLYPSILNKLGGDISHYYIYIVYDMGRKPKLFIMQSKIIFLNLAVEPKLILHPARIKTDNSLSDEKL